MDNLLQDLRYAMRTLLRAPGFSLIVIISIALGFAANATVFSVANGLLWGLLPVKDPGKRGHVFRRPVLFLSRLP